MASAKGIAITAAIIAGVVGASMFVWFGPQPGSNGTNPGREVTADNINSFRSDEAFGSIYSRHQSVASDVSFDYERWKRGDIDSTRMLATISNAKSASSEMRGAFEAASPPETWQASFDHYSAALGGFSGYLNEMERLVRAGDRNPDETTLNEHLQNSENHLELALQSIPVSPIG